MARGKIERSRTTGAAAKSSDARLSDSSVSYAEAISKINKLLIQVQALMKDNPYVDHQTYEAFGQLHARMRFAVTAAAQSVLLPTTAPVYWADRQNKKQTPVEFIRSHYSPWLGRGLTRAHIRKLDNSLYLALYRWKAEGGEIPVDLNLPTKKQAIDLALHDLGTEDPQNTMRSALRLYQAARRRAEKKR